MKKFLLALVLTIATSCAFASKLDSDAARQAGFNDLTAQQQADIIKQIADKRAQGDTSGIPTTKKVNDWLDIGERIGSGMAGAAKEMGVAVNDFAKSPVGMWTVALITWHFMGSAIIHFVGGLMIWAIGFTFIVWMARRSGDVTEKFDPEKKDIFGRSRRVSRDRESLSSDAVGGFTICAGIVLVLGLVTVLTF